MTRRMRSGPLNPTSRHALEEIKKWDQRPWRAMQSGLIPIIDEDTGLTARFDFGGTGTGTSGFVQAGIKAGISTDLDPLAVVGHQRNEDAESVCMDLTLAPAGYFPSHDFYVASAACNAHSKAAGKKRTEDDQASLLDDDDEYLETPDEAEKEKKLARERSQLLFSEIFVNMSNELDTGKPFKAAIIENVGEAATKWDGFLPWVKNVEGLGYHVQILNFDGRFAHGENFVAPAQDRNRIIVICTYRGPIKDRRMPIIDPDRIRPPAWCLSEDKLTNARLTWKDVDSLRGVKPELRVGEHGKHYIYCCENCGKPVEPLSLSAMDHLDESLPMVAMKDRKTPLAPATQERIYNALAKVALPLAMEGASSADRPPSLSQMFMTTVESEGRGNLLRGSAEPTRTLTQQATDAVCRVDFAVTLNGGGSMDGGRDVSTEAAGTLMAGGGHHGWATTMVQRMNSENGQRGGEMTKPDSQELNTLTTRGHQAVLRAPVLRPGDGGALFTYNKKSVTRSPHGPAPTITQVDRIGFVRVRAEALANSRDIIRRSHYTAKDVPREWFDNTEFRMLGDDEGGSMMGENNGRILPANKRDAMSVHGRGVIVQVFRLVAQELVWAIYPDQRKESRLPDIRKILQHHVDEMVRRVAAGEERIDIIPDDSPLVIPNRDDRAAIDAQLAKDARREVREANRTTRLEKAAVEAGLIIPDEAVQQRTPLPPPPSPTTAPKTRGTQSGFDFSAGF